MKLFPPCTLALHACLAHSHCKHTSKTPLPNEFVPPPIGSKAATNGSRTAAPHPHMKLFPPCTLALHTHLARTSCTHAYPIHPPAYLSPLDLCKGAANGSRTAAHHPHIKHFSPCTLTLHTFLAHSPCTFTPLPPKPSPFPLGFVQESSQWELQNSPPSPYKALLTLHTRLAHSHPQHPPTIPIPALIYATK